VVTDVPERTAVAKENQNENAIRSSLNASQLSGRALAESAARVYVQKSSGPEVWTEIGVSSLATLPILYTRSEPSEDS
jgi:hypothetical protein